MQGGEIDPPLPTAVQSELVHEELLIRVLPNEQMVAYDLTGAKIFHQDGTEDEVSIPEEAYEMLRNSVVTHNHPGGHSFSEDDLVTAVELDLYELRIVSRRFTYRLRRPAQGWGSNAISKAQLAYDQVRAEINQLVASGKITFELAREHHHHELAKRFANVTGAHYRRQQED